MDVNSEAHTPILQNNEAKCDKILSNDNIVSDALEESLINNKKSCRICYETDKQETMIAPCLCGDDLKFVHRACLDEYRAISVSNPAFTTCNTCQFNYIMDIENNYGCCQSPKTVFRLRVMFDIFKIAFCWFGIVSLLAFIFKITQIKDTLYTSYLLSLAIVFGLMGIIAIIHGCFKLIDGNESNDRRRVNRHNTDSDCCTGCIYFGPIGNCGDCNCDCGGGGDAGAVIAVILFLVAIILIIIGIVYAIIVSFVFIAQMAARHYSTLNAKLMAREYVVKNLEKYPRKKLLKLKEEQQICKEQQMPIPSAPEFDGISSDKPIQHKTITIM